MNSWVQKVDEVFRTLSVGAKDDSDTSKDDWGRLSGVEKVARAQGLAREAYRRGDKNLAQKWRDIAAEIEPIKNWVGKKSFKKMGARTQVQ